MSNNKAKAEGIFPLSALQQAYLIHHLRNEDDNGELQGHLELTGKLDFEVLQEAWQLTAQRHSALRTSVHWEKIEKPVQVIRKEVAVPVIYYDWSSLNEKAFEQKIANIYHDENYRINITKAPVSKVVVIKKTAEKHVLLWNCHHILTDGWSTAIVLQDVFKFYEALLKNQTPDLAPLPTYKMYYGKLTDQKTENAKSFWSDYLSSDFRPLLFEPQNASSPKAKFKNHTFFLSENDSSEIQKYCRNARITLGTFLKGLWAILLSKYFETEFVTFGTTVSGRTLPLSNIDLMAGLFMNVLPVQSKINPKANLGDQLRIFQKEQIRTSKFEHIPLNEILSWSNTNHSSLFDSVIVLENIPWESFESGGLHVKGIKKFPKTSYPLTLGILPSEKFKFLFRYNQTVLKDSVINWFADQIQILIKNVITLPDLTIEDLRKGLIEPPSKPALSKPNVDIQKIQSGEYQPPQNDLELKLTQIWEKVTGVKPIGITDNFFEIGGKSLQAVQILNLIQQKLNVNLPPISLIQNPTIQLLSQIISKGNVPKTWSALLPLKTSGSKPPLFCLHAGGAHTFFYNNLLKYLSEDQPLYSLQPSGLDDPKNLHKDAVEMARDYLSEIKSVQPKGPYIFVIHCFSVVVGMEMIRQLHAENEFNAVMINVDSDFPQYVFSPQTAGPKPTAAERIKFWYSAGLKRAWSVLKRKTNHYYDNKIKPRFESTQERNLRLAKDNLVRIFFEYHWKPVKGKKIYIRSTEFVEKLGDEDVENWRTFFPDGIDLYIIEGHHRTIFEEPEVQGLARQLQECLDILSEKYFRHDSVV